MEYIETEKLIPYEKNAKEHTKKQVEQVANSIKEFGFNQPIVVDKENVVIVGHGRLQAAKFLGLKEVPYVMVDLTDEQAKAYRLADNKLNESAWDMGLVMEELKGLSGEMIALTGFNFDVDLGEDSKYTKKIIPPIYEPKNELPPVSNCYDREKTNQLIEDIQKSTVSDENKEFLVNAAHRLTVFNYEKIADFYAHQDPETKELMEKLALVIIDFNKAIENGYVKSCDALFDSLENE